MENKKLDIEKLTSIIALFLHAAKIDDNYSEKEKIILEKIYLGKLKI